MRLQLTQRGVELVRARRAEEDYGYFGMRKAEMQRHFRTLTADTLHNCAVLGELILFSLRDDWLTIDVGQVQAIHGAGKKAASEHLARDDPNAALRSSGNRPVECCLLQHAQTDLN